LHQAITEINELPMSEEFFDSPEYAHSILILPDLMSVLLQLPSLSCLDAVLSVMKYVPPWAETVVGAIHERLGGDFSTEQFGSFLRVIRLFQRRLDLERVFEVLLEKAVFRMDFIGDFMAFASHLPEIPPLPSVALFYARAFVA
jgi:hypothetical protein